MRDRTEFRYVFLVSAAACALMLVQALVAYREPVTAEERRAGRSIGRVLADMLLVLGNWRFVLLLVIFFIGLGMFNGITTWIEEIVGPRGFSTSQAGLAGGLMLIGGIVGAFVLLFGAALVGGTLWLSSGEAYRQSYQTYLVYMSESVAGLSPDATVSYRGVQVGRVRKIELAPNNGELVRLTLDIVKGTPIKQDTIAVLRTQGLTGIAHVELSGGSPSSPPLTAKPGEQYPVIPSGPSLLARLDTAVTDLLDNLNKSSSSLNAVLDDAIPSTGEPIPYFHSFFRMADGSTIAFFEAPELPPLAPPPHPAYDTFQHLAMQERLGDADQDFAVGGQDILGAFVAGGDELLNFLVDLDGRVLAEIARGG